MSFCYRVINIDDFWVNTDVIRSIPGIGVDPKVVNVNNSVVKRHKLLKIDTLGKFMTGNSMVTSIFEFEHAMTS